MPGSVGHATDLRGDPGYVIRLVHRGHRPGTKEATLALLHVVRAPVVVGPGLGLGKVDVTLALQAEQHRRIQHGQVDVVLVHVLQPGLGIPRRRAGLGVAHLAPERPGPVLVAGAGDTGRRHPVGGRPSAVVDEPLLAGLVGLDMPDPVPVLGRRIVGHRRWDARGCGHPNRCSARRQPSSCLHSSLGAPNRRPSLIIAGGFIGRHGCVTPAEPPASVAFAHGN